MGVEELLWTFPKAEWTDTSNSQRKFTKKISFKGRTNRSNGRSMKVVREYIKLYKNFNPEKVTNEKKPQGTNGTIVDERTPYNPPTKRTPLFI